MVGPTTPGPALTGRWPLPGWDPLRIARHMTGVYREHLRANNRALCDQVDATMLAYGQTWIAPGVAVHNPDQAITADLAAALVSKTESTIRRWACTPHPDDPGRMLLPRHGWDGRRRTYLVRDVQQAAEIADTARRVAN